MARPQGSMQPCRQAAAYLHNMQRGVGGGSVHPRRSGCNGHSSRGGRPVSRGGREGCGPQEGRRGRLGRGQACEWCRRGLVPTRVCTHPAGTAPRADQDSGTWQTARAAGTRASWRAAADSHLDLPPAFATTTRSSGQSVGRSLLGLVSPRNSSGGTNFRWPLERRRRISMS